MLAKKKKYCIFILLFFHVIYLFYACSCVHSPAVLFLTSVVSWILSVLCMKVGKPNNFREIDSISLNICVWENDTELPSKLIVKVINDE